MKTDASRTIEVKSFWDWLGIAISGVCLLHCIALPALIAFLPAIGMNFLLHANVHKALALTLIPTSAIAFIPGYLKHRNQLVWLFAVPGLSILIFSAFFMCGRGLCEFERPLSILGGILLLFAHIANRTFCRRCSTCKH